MSKYYLSEPTPTPDGEVEPVDYVSIEVKVILDADGAGDSSKNNICYKGTSFEELVDGIYYINNKLLAPGGPRKKIL